MTDLSINGPATLTAISAIPALTVEIPALSTTLSTAFTGSARLSQASAFGALTDLGVTPFASTTAALRTPWVDPAAAMTVNHGVTDTSNGWRRTYLTTTVPQGRNTGAPAGTTRGAAYAALAVRLPNLPKGSMPQLNSVMVERHTTANLLDHDAAYHLNALCYTGNGCTVALSGDRVLVGNRSLKCTVTTPAAPEIGPIPTFAALAQLPDNPPPLVFSVSVATSFAESFSVRAAFYDAVGTTLSSTDAGQTFTTRGTYAWTPGYITVTPPPTAVYASVVPVLRPSATLQVGESIYTAAHAIRYQSLTAPRTGKTGYRPARHMTINLHADRINLARNPSLTTNTPGIWRNCTPEAETSAAVTLAVGRTRPGAAVFRATPAASETVHPEGTRIGIGSTVGQQPLTTTLEIINTGRQHILSGYIREQPDNTLPVRPFVRITQDVPGTGPVTTVHRGISTAEVRAQYPQHVDGEWVRVWAVITPPPGSPKWLSAWFGPAPEDFTASAVSSFHLDDVQLEEGAALQPYFDGGAHTADYLWEDTGPAAADSGEYTRSHYYRDRRTIQRRLKDTLTDHIQHGTPYDLTYATAPTPAPTEPLPPLAGRPSASLPPVAGVRATQVNSRSAVVHWSAHEDTGRSIIVRKAGRPDTVRAPGASGVLLSDLTPQTLHHITVLRRNDATGAESAPTTLTLRTTRTAWPEGLRNEAADPSFELSAPQSGGQVGTWTINRETTPVGLAVDTTLALTGQRSLRMTSRADGAGYGISMWPHRRTVVPGQQWTLSAWVRSTTARPAEIWIRWWAEGGTTNIAISDKAATLPANTWTYLTVTATAPPGADRAFGHFHFPQQAAGETYWIDGVSFTRTPGPVEYADGSVPGWEWNGQDADRTSHYIGIPGEHTTPGRLQITDIGAYSATIIWDPANPTNLQRSIIIRQGDQTLAEVPKATGYMRLTGLKPSTDYTYTVTQRYEDGQESGPQRLVLTTQADTWTKGLVNGAPNPNFEYGALTGNRLGPWSADQPTATLSLSSTAFTGTRSLALRGQAGTTTALTHAGQTQPTTEGDTWTASGWVYSTVAATTHTALRWQDSTGADVLLQQSTGIPLLPGEWQRITVTGKAPAKTTQVHALFVFDNQTDGESYQVDAVMLTKTPGPVEYADGDTTGWRWNTTPGTTSTYVDDGAPPAPLNLQVLRKSEKDLSVTWDQPPADRALTARLWLGGVKQWEGDAAVRSVRFTGLTPATAYTVDAAYFDAARGKESPKSTLNVTTDPAKWPVGLVNYAPDPGFEYLKRDANGLIGGIWTLNRDTRITELDINTTNGKHFLQYTARDGAYVAATHNPKRIAVVPGETWTASAYFLGLNTDKKCSIVFIWWDKNGNELPHAAMTPQTVPKGAWNRLSFTDTAPAGAVEMYTMYRFGDPTDLTKKGELYYLENVMVTRGAQTYPAASGDTEDWEWIGGPGGTSRYKGWPGAQQPAKSA
ncbi:fibronectin type III domain-containing protein [Streptomyces sp. NPDC020379]|uniref:fibronectin type III domain-containing protein n=1 Tax=Streptomyces sp. NPDC020379 TaxID=3365071 RepID=UPI0037AEDB46